MPTPATFPMTRQLAHPANPIPHTQYPSPNKICEIRDTRCQIRTSFVQNKPNLHKPEICPILFLHKGLRQKSPLRHHQKQTQTNPNKANPTPVFRSPGAPEAKTNPSKPKAKPIELEAEIPVGQLLEILKPGTKQTQFRTPHLLIRTLAFNARTPQPASAEFAVRRIPAITAAGGQPPESLWPEGLRSGIMCHNLLQMRDLGGGRPRRKKMKNFRKKSLQNQRGTV